MSGDELSREDAARIADAVDEWNYGRARQRMDDMDALVDRVTADQERQTRASHEERERAFEERLANQERYGWLGDLTAEEAAARRAEIDGKAGADDDEEEQS